MVKKYIKDDVSIAKWGKRSYIWIDKKAEDAQTLLANAQSLLSQWKEPSISFEIGSADLSILPEYAGEEKILNGVTRIMVDGEEYLARIIGEEIADISREYEVKYQINNKVSDIATTQADMERKIQVNEAYSQGATNIMNYSYHDNCDASFPVVIPFLIDDDVVNVNTCELTYRTKPFRAYEKAVSGGGAVTTTSNNTNLPPLQINSNISEPYDSDHRHKITIASLAWTLHEHNIELEDHIHNIEFGIYELGTLPDHLVILIDGNVVLTQSLQEDRLDIMEYLSKDSNGRVARGMHEISILPNALARIEADVVLRVFIQSRLGGAY